MSTKTPAKQNTKPVKTPATKAVKGAKTGKPTSPKAGTNGQKQSKRLRLFALLAKHPMGLNNAQIRTALGTQAVAALCRDEAVAGRLKVLQHEDQRGKFFTLSPTGKKALEKGTVDSDAAPKATWSA